MSKFIYYEPRTGTIFADQPPRRNVYKLLNTKANWRTLQGAVPTACRGSAPSDLIGWLEKQEKLANAAS